MANLRDLQDIHEKFAAVTALYAECQTQIEGLKRRLQNLELKNARDAKSEKNKKED